MNNNKNKNYIYVSYDNRVDNITMPTMDNLLERYVAYLDVTAKSVETYTRALKQFSLYLKGENITQPDREDIIAFKEKLIETDHKATTVTNYIESIKLFFDWTEQEGIYPNVAKHVKGAKISKEHKKDCLTVSQTKAILESIDSPRDKALFLLMVTCGLRTIEVERANIGDLRNIGDKTVLFIQGKGKSDKSDYITIPGETEKALRKYLATRKFTTDRSPLFVSTSNNSKEGRLSTRTIRGTIKDIFRKNGLDSDRLTAHSLRHTAITISLLNGESLEDTKDFARHSSINTTMIYNHAIDKANNKCSNSIEKALFQ